MKLLLDTHALIWFAEGHARLSRGAQDALHDPSNEVFYSVASIWELAIKLSLGKLAMSVKLDDAFERLLERNGLLALPVLYGHAARVALLPLHHRDPFDRLLIAQAEIERMPLVSHDPVIDAYKVQRIW